MKSVFEVGLPGRVAACAIEVEKEAREKDMKSCVSCTEMVVNRKEFC